LDELDELPHAEVARSIAAAAMAPHRLVGFMWKFIVIS